MKPPPAVRSLLNEVIELCDEEKAANSPYYSLKTHGIPPKEIRIFESTDADWDRAICTKEANRAWKWNNEKTEEIEASNFPDYNERPNGMYWSIGLIQYWIDTTSGRAIYTFTLGPRYGRGFRMEFTDESNLRFNTNREHMRWLS